MSKHWLSGLLRARQLQEDSAKQRLAGAQRESQHARGRVRYHVERIESLVAADAVDSAPAFTAAAAALQAAAATHSAAVRAVDDADQFVSLRHGELTAAARARRTVEEMHEQHLAEIRARHAAAAMREMDEVAARVHRDGTDGGRR